MVGYSFFIWNKEERFVKNIELSKKSFKGINCQGLVFSQANFIKRYNKYLKIFSSIAWEKFKIKTDFNFSQGASDVRFFKDKKYTWNFNPTKGRRS